MRTTLNINDALLQELREKAVQEKKPFRRVIEETLQKGLRHLPKTENTPISLPVYDVGLKSAYRGMSLNQIYDQIESEKIRVVAEG
jgi:hypothetical protein